MNRTARRLLLGACLTLLPVAPARAEDEPQGEPAPRPPALVPIVADPVAAQTAQRAAEALAAGRPDVVLTRCEALVRDHARVPVALHVAGVRREDEGARGLHWPAARVANRLVARLDAAHRTTWTETFAPITELLWARVRLGDARARRELSTRYAATADGRRALLLAAELAAERGAWAWAARHFREWLALLPPDTPADVRAPIVLRLSDVLAAMADAGGARDLIRQHADLLEVPVGPPNARAPLHDAIARLESRRAEPVAASARVAPELPEPTLVWSRSLLPASSALPPEGQTDDIVRAGAWTDGDRWLVVHDGRRVHAFDVSTGVVRWRFPRATPRTLHHLAQRYAPNARPTRAVVPAGESVLVVMGDLPASGSYMFHGERVGALGQAHECRTRLASIELETGRLRWATGLAPHTHPLLGDPRVGCTSPPLVAGDRVYAMFGRLAGTELHAACLDRETGAPIWSQLIGSGESGRSLNRANQQRLQSRYVDALPWGAKPALHDGELCLVTHAGMAVGLDAHTGDVRWMRALPRFTHATTASEGQSPRNVPLPYGDTWILAPEDCPALLALEQGSGALRWMRPMDRAPGGPRWRHLCGIGTDADGHVRLRLSGMQPHLVDPTQGDVLDDPAHVTWERDVLRPISIAGRPWSDDDFVMVARGGHLQIAPWVPDARPDAVVQTVAPLSGRGAPRGGTVLRAGDRVVVLGSHRLGVYDLEGLNVDRLRTTTDPAADVVARAMLACRVRDASALEAVGAAFRELIAPEARDATPRLTEVLAHALAPNEDGLHTEWIRAVASVAAGLPPRARARLRRELLVAWENAGALGEAYELARSWLESGDRSLVEIEGRDGTDGRAWMRADLFAARFLEAIRSDPALTDAESARNAHWTEVFSRAEGDARMLQWIAERGRGTHAADSAQFALATLAWKGGRWSEAAAWLAEHRSSARRRPAARERVARWQLDEAVAWGLAGHEFEARNLAAELVRWAPETTGSLDKRTLNAVRTDLQRRFAWHPERGGFDLDVWPGREPSKEEIRSVEWLTLAGPGAPHWNGLALLVRGYQPEIWSLEHRERVATLPGDQGWFGGTLHSVDEWIPGGGVLVASVVAGEPADRAGLKSRDWIRSWDGEPCSTLDIFLRQIAQAQPGRSISVDVRRTGARVLSRFQPGARPPKHGRAMDYAPVWVGVDGRALLPTRSGLVAVTPRPPQQAPFWSWSGDGIVRRVDVAGDTAYVTVRRRMRGAVLVAVDAKTGRERWRTELEGETQRVECTGSAVVVHARRPDQVHVLDRWDGSVRARRRLFDAFHHEFARHYNPRKVSSAGLGRVAMVLGQLGHARLALMDVATGDVTWTAERNRLLDHRFSPHVSTGGFVASIQSPTEIRIVLPDPLGDAPQQLRLDKRGLLTDQRHHGRIDNDTRFTVRGRRLYLERVPGGGTLPVRLGVFEIDERALRSRPPSDTPLRAAGAMTYRTDIPLLGGDMTDDRYVIDSIAAFDGLLVLAARMGAEERVEAAWLHAEPIRGPNLLADTNGSLSLHNDVALEVRRHAPRRSGNVLLVPTDRGARVIPVRAAR